MQDGGHILVTFKSAFADENTKVWHDETPHVLGEVCGISYSHFTLPEEVRLRAGEMDMSGEAEVFMECLNLEGAKPLVMYNHASFGRYAAITRNTYGGGAATYLGCGLSRENLKKLVYDTTANAGIPIPELQFPVIVRSGVNQDGRTVRYYMNFSGESQAAACVESGIDLLAEEPVHEAQPMQLDPWGLAIVES